MLRNSALSNSDTLPSMMAVPFQQLPFYTVKSESKPQHGLVHSRLQQLLFEWLLLPQTSALIRQIANDDHHKDTTEIQDASINSDHMCGSPPLRSASRRFPTILPTSPKTRPPDSLTLISPCGFDECTSPITRYSSNSRLLLNFAETGSPIVIPPRSPARRDFTNSRLDRSLLQQDLAPLLPVASQQEPFSLHHPTKGASASNDAASPQLRGALIKTAAEATAAATADTPQIEGHFKGSTHQKKTTSPPTTPVTPVGIIPSSLQITTTNKINKKGSSVQTKLCLQDVAEELNALDLSGLERRFEEIGFNLSKKLGKEEVRDEEVHHEDKVVIIKKLDKQKEDGILDQEIQAGRRGDLENESQNKERRSPPEISLKYQKESKRQKSKESGTDDKLLEIQNNNLSESPNVVVDIKIPRFYHERKKDLPSDILDQEIVDGVDGVFRDFPSGIDLENFESKIIVGLLNLSKFMSGPVFELIDTDSTGKIQKDKFLEFCKGRIVLGDETLNFFNLVKQKHNDFIRGHEFTPYLKAILDRHVGMEFLKETPEFQKRYNVQQTAAHKFGDKDDDFPFFAASTVIARFLYVLDPFSTGKIHLNDLRNFDKKQAILSTNVLQKSSNASPNALKNESNDMTFLSFPAIWRSLDNNTDLNHERLFFSYEHFYVIYCTFWELDLNHDFQLDKQDLLRYDGHALSQRTIDRVLQVFLKNGSNGSNTTTTTTTTTTTNCFIGYEDFIVFLFNDEDKTTDRSLSFWFNVLDLDGDGYIRAAAAAAAAIVTHRSNILRYYEMQYFYEEQSQRLESLQQEIVAFSDILCQMNDFLKPKTPTTFSLADFKRHRKTSAFHLVHFSLSKFMAYESRDPFQLKQELSDFPYYTPWDRFCRREYEKLSVEEDEEESHDGCEWNESSSPTSEHLKSENGLFEDHSSSLEHQARAVTASVG